MAEPGSALLATTASAPARTSTNLPADSCTPEIDQLSVHDEPQYPHPSSPVNKLEALDLPDVHFTLESVFVQEAQELGPWILRCKC
jgi:hypothetical protein